MSNSAAPSADLPPDVQAALDRLAHFYDGSQPYNPNTNPGGMRNGGHRRNFVPALVDAVTAVNAIVALMQSAIAIGNDVTSTAAIAQPLLDQAVARLQEALQAADDAETARDGAQTARTGSEAAQAASEAASASSDQSRAAAVVARSGAETAQAGSETAQAGAEAAFSDADDARVAAQTARLAAEDAQTGARAARADAASYAAQIGVAAYDFSFDTDPDPSNDWSTG